MIPGFERAKTFHALDRAATVNGLHEYTFDLLLSFRNIGGSLVRFRRVTYLYTTTIHELHVYLENERTYV
jgi:hypothetical protein